MLLKVGPLAGAMDGDGGAVPRRLEPWSVFWLVEVQSGMQWRRDGDLVGAVGPIASIGSCACCGCCCLTSQSISVDTIEVNQLEAN